MAKWIKCKSCGKSFAKQDIQNGICIICDPNRSAQPPLDREDTVGDIEESGHIGSALENENLAFKTDTDDQESDPQIGADAKDDEPDSVDREPIDRTDIPGFTHDVSTANTSDFQAFKSNINAIRFAEKVNDWVLFIGLFVALIVLGVVTELLNAGVGIFVAGLASFIAIVGWAFTRMFIGIAQDIRASRDNSDKLLALVRDQLTTEAESSKD
jgi:hypothetical protein